MRSPGIPAGVWLVRGGRKDELVDEFRETGAIALDWPDIGDLALISSLDEFKLHVLQAFSGDSPDHIRDELKYLLWFVRLIAVDDYALIDKKQTDEVIVGTVTSAVEYNPGVFGVEYPYIRRVKWLKHIARDLFTLEAQQDLYSILPIEDIRSHRYEIHKHITGEDYSEKFEPYQDIGVLKALVRELAGETDDFLHSVWGIYSGGPR